MLAELMKALGLGGDEERSHPSALLPAAQVVPPAINKPSVYQPTMDWWEKVQQEDKLRQQRKKGAVYSDPSEEALMQQRVIPMSPEESLMQQPVVPSIPSNEGHWLQSNSRIAVAEAAKQGALKARAGAEYSDPSEESLMQQRVIPMDPEESLMQQPVVPSIPSRQGQLMQSKSRMAVAEAEKQANLQASDDSYEAYAQPLIDQGYTPKLRMMWEREQIAAKSRVVQIRAENAAENKLAAENSYKKFLDNGGNSQDISLEDWISTSDRRRTQFMAEVISEKSIAAGGTSGLGIINPLDWYRTTQAAKDMLSPDPNEEGAVPSLQKPIPPSGDKTPIDPIIKKELDEKIASDPTAADLLTKAAEVDIENTKLKPEELKEIDDLSQKVAEGFWDGKTVKAMMEGAGNFLGDRLADPAIQNALIYYVGARLMGYTNSESGMAAGMVLQDQWSTAGKARIAKQKLIDDRYDKKLIADAKKEKESLDRDEVNLAAKKKFITPDMSKTVMMFDKKSQTVVEGHMAPNGDFYQSGAKDEDGNPLGVNSVQYGLVTYKPSFDGHRTKDEVTKDLYDVVQKQIDTTLATLDDDNYDHADVARSAFKDGIAGGDMVNNTIRALQNSGLKVNTPAFEHALRSTVKKAIQNVAKVGADKNGVVGSDLASTVSAMMIKSNIRGGGTVPDFVFDRPVAWKNGQPQGKTKGFQLSNPLVSSVMSRVTRYATKFIEANSDGTFAGDQKARQMITPTKTIQKFAQIFKDEVMSDPERVKYWTDRGDAKSSNAFAEWLDADMKGLKPEDKYMGLNNKDIFKLVTEMYNTKKE
tara:strand:- start:3958 stop:6399 length:2442 start_codon:yes stop_codon:yes gene_type:complete